MSVLKNLKILLHNKKKPVIEEQQASPIEESTKKVTQLPDKSNLDKLADAIKNDSLNSVTTLLAEGLDPNQPFVNNEYPIHLAVKAQSLPIVQVIAIKANVSVGDAQGKTALHWSVYYSNMPIMEYLLSQNADVNASDKDGQTSLHLASIHDNYPAAEILIKHGATVDKMDRFNETALHNSVWTGNLKMIDLLVQSFSTKSEQMAFVNIKNIDNFTAYEKVTDLFGDGSRDVKLKLMDLGTEYKLKDLIDEKNSDLVVHHTANEIKSTLNGLKSKLFGFFKPNKAVELAGEHNHTHDET